MDNTYILIIAGGEGTRFVPLSTPERPKQFLSFVGEGTFIQQTRRRIAELVPADRILVATNERYVPLVREQLSDIPESNIIGEPLKKNTAPCIAYAARLVLERDPLAAMVVLPSDHVIRREDRFRDVIRQALRSARDGDCLVTLGIKPEWPSSDYGYIKSSGRFPGIVHTACGVERFVEKPDETTARRYIDDGNYYWNSGMFVWTARSIMREIAAHLPDMDSLLRSFTTDDNFMRSFFEKVEGISIDYGIMEKSKRTTVIPCDLGWSDVGTWEGLKRLSTNEEITIAPDAMTVMRERLGMVSNEQ